MLHRIEIERISDRRHCSDLLSRDPNIPLLCTTLTL